jgi:acyl-CoA thioester hydrolase
MKTYTEVLNVSPEDLDDLDHVNNIRYVEWIQDISKKHWEKVAPQAMRNEMAWVVRNHNINYLKSAVLGDTLQVSTYIKNNTGPLSVRVVEIKNNKTGQLLVNAHTEWCLLDARTFRPKRVPEAINNLFL